MKFRLPSEIINISDIKHFFINSTIYKFWKLTMLLLNSLLLAISAGKLHITPVSTFPTPPPPPPTKQKDSKITNKQKYAESFGSSTLLSFEHTSFFLVFSFTCFYCEFRKPAPLVCNVK